MMLAADLEPANMVHRAGFRNLIHHFEPGYILPHRTTFTRTHLPDLMEEVKTKVLKQLETAEHVVFTTDCWTDDYAHNKYMCVTAHYISPTWELVSFLLATIPLEGSVTGELLNKQLLLTLKEWKLSRISRTLVTDQGADILKAGRIGGWQQFECFAHRLDLCIMDHGMDVVKDVKSVLTKCKDIVRFLRYKSPEVCTKQQELNDLMENVVENDHIYSSVITEAHNSSLKQYYAKYIYSCSEKNVFMTFSSCRCVSTRWSSVWIMIDSIMKNRAVIHSLMMKYGKRELLFRSKELRFLEKLLQFLKPFKEHTTKMQADKWPTLSRVWPTVLALIATCQPTSALERDTDEDSDDYDSDAPDGVISVSYYTVLEQLKSAVLAAIIRKFPKDELFLLATSLDPNFKGLRGIFKTSVYWKYFCNKKNTFIR